MGSQLLLNAEISSLEVLGDYLFPNLDHVDILMSTTENFFGGVRIFGQKIWKGMYFLGMLLNRQPSDAPFWPPKIETNFFIHSVSGGWYPG